MRYGTHTYEEIAALAASGAVALLPLGCTEQQGPHLPVAGPAELGGPAGLVGSG